MANTIEIFNSAKLNVEKLTGSNSYFNSLGEITESAKLQNKFISNIDYSDPANFARFGLAEEYYKNAITFIATDYPYDGSKAVKTKWLNSLNELEYYIFTHEYPKYSGYVELSGAQYIGVYSPSREIPNTDIKNVYVNGEKYFVRENLNFSDGFTFESWIKFDNASNTPQILNINTVYSSSGGGVVDLPLLKVYASANKIYLSGTVSSTNFAYNLIDDEWHHYAISINANSSSLYVDGTRQEQLATNTFANTSDSFVFYKAGLVPIALTGTFSETGSLYQKAPVFKLGSGSIISYDETRFWNKEKSLEKIGGFWFTKVDGNDFSDQNNSDLIFYYKFDEGWDVSGSYCLDYSGYQNLGLIFNYGIHTARIAGSAINSSSIVQDFDSGDVIYVPSLNYSTGTLGTFYTTKILSGSDYDVTNRNTLYKKFPSWILEQEDEQEIKHLKQVIQIVSSYFDDLYNKISEINKYKHLQNTSDETKLYPFYDKILTATGFDVTELFNNLTFLEKFASRTDVNLFDEDISKIKNSIYQNIYNNLSYILKSKGTEKSLRSFLRSYGINENLVRINLYADKSNYTITDKYTQTTVKKKTVNLIGSSSIYLNGTSFISTEEFTLETAVIFPKIHSTIPETGSVVGFFISDSLNIYQKSPANLQAYVTLENTNNGYKFCFRTGSSYDLVASSSYFSDVYDDTIWNIAISVKPNVDDIKTATAYNYQLDFRIVNTYKEDVVDVYNSSIFNNFGSGFVRYFIGADNTNLTGTNIYPTNAKYLYCNYWTKYLTDNELESHNRDILNYGVEQ